MRHGLKTGLNNVVELCLSAGADPNMRFESWVNDLDTDFPPTSRVPSHQPERSSVVVMVPRQPGSHLENGRNGPSPSPSDNSGDEAGNYSDDEPGNYSDGEPGPGEYKTDFGMISFHVSNACYWTPLHVAATHGDIELLSLLLEHGANPNSAGRGVCPCQLVPLRRTFGRSMSTFDEDVSELMDRNIATRWSPLHVAVCKGKLGFARELISRFGLPRPIESDDAVLAEAHRFIDNEGTLAPLVRFWPDAFDEFTPRFDPLPPLHVAVEKYASLEDIKKLYAMLEKAGCLNGQHSGVDVLDAFGDTPFAVAAFSGRTQTVGSWLRERGADVNLAIRDLEGRRRSILYALCGLDLYADALFLMDMGVDINRDVELNSGGRHMSALHRCCGHWHAGPQQREGMLVIKRLIHAGADVNAKKEDGTTPLMSTARKVEPDAVVELLQAKADVGAEDDSGNCALHHAVERALHLEPSAKLSAALVIIQLLLDSGADPNQHSESRGPPLFTLQYRLQGTPAISYSEPDSTSTPFDIARHSMAWIAPLLISRGADPNMYLEDPRDDIEGEDFEEMLEEFGGRSLAVTAFYRGEFDSLDSLLAWGTIVTGPDYLLMMRSLIDPIRQNYRTRPGAVEALFRVLNSASLRLERFEDRKGIMDAWTEVLYIAVGSRPMLVPSLAPHISLTNMCGPGGKTVLHLMVQWERRRYESPAQFDERIREVMSHLFRCGAARQIDQLDNSGRSPLFLAVERGNIPVAKQLVQFGASLHIEHNKLFGSPIVSPLKLAIKSYTKVIRFKIAVKTLEVSQPIHGSIAPGLLKDLILHFGGNPFDNPSRMSIRTTKLMEKLLDKGIHVNESDEHGNTALHHLIQLLYPSNEGSKKPGNLEGVSSFRPPIRAVRNAGSTKYPAGTDPVPKRHFELSAEQDMQMNGHNDEFVYDRDHAAHEDVCNLDDYDMSAEGDDSDGGDAVEATELFAPRNELGELANHDPRVASHRCKTWMSTFVFLLDRGASLTIRNNSGKTALDYIDELRSGQARPCPKMYGPVIPALSDYVKRPPFDAELLAKLDQADLTAKGTPLLLVHDHIHLVSMDKDGPEETRKAESEASEKGKTCWLPFW